MDWKMSDAGTIASPADPNVVAASVERAWNAALGRLPERYQSAHLVLAHAGNLQAPKRRAAELPRVTPDLEQHRTRAAFWVTEGLQHLAELNHAFADLPHLAGLLDADGVVLYAQSNRTHLLAETGFEPGRDWSLAAAGETVPGYALAADRAVAMVVSPSPLFGPHCASVCAVAPVHAGGHVIGAIALSARIDVHDAPRLALLHDVAAQIDARLAAPRPEPDTEHVQSVARVSSFIAHELTSPISALKATLAMIPDQAEPETRSRMFDRCVRIAQRMEELANDLRALSGAHHLETERVELADWLQQQVSQMRIPSPYQTVINVERDVRADIHSRLLARAIGNLVTNAIEAMPEGGTVGFDLSASAFGPRLSVWDDGQGVPESYLAQLFRLPFTTKLSGSGLGLLLVKAIVENAHAGRIGYRPNEPHGARFDIDLPLDPPGAPA
ncbi:MAG TPA: ATP-binding protein [Limnochordia bacterium]|nr:ATP-binding protein [Limnochordia bacterium]